MRLLLVSLGLIYLACTDFGTFVFAAILLLLPLEGIL